MSYSDLLKDPRWQKKRLEIFERDKFTCQFCGSKQNTLSVHHLLYLTGKKPWEYDNDKLITTCNNCHGILSDKNNKYVPSSYLFNVVNKGNFNDFEIAWLGNELKKLGDMRSRKKYVFFKKFLGLMDKYFIKAGY